MSLIFLAALYEGGTSIVNYRPYGDVLLVKFELGFQGVGWVIFVSSVRLVFMEDKVALLQGF